jgi:hypothetical protein
MHLDNGSDELLHKVVPEKTGPEMVDKVDEEAFDVGAVLILICHDHQLPVPQGTQSIWAVVLLLEVKTQDLDQVVDLGIVHDLSK